MNFEINPANKFYPAANEWMWNYCIFLGKFTDSNGVNYDLGLHINDKQPAGFRYSDATVHSDRAGDYTSGNILMALKAKNVQPHIVELYKRATALNLIKVETEL